MAGPLCAAKSRQSSGGVGVMTSRVVFSLLCVACLAMFEARDARAAPITLDRTQAFRFLEQSTFGPKQTEIDPLAALARNSDPYESWIDEQMAVPPSLLLPVLQAKYASGTTGTEA